MSSARVPVLTPADKLDEKHIPDRLSDIAIAELARDAVVAMLRSGAGVTLTANDATDSLVITATATGGDAEMMRDTIGAALVGINGVVVAVNDAADTITLSVSGLTISQVTGLQSALDGKASVSSLAGLASQSSVDAKAPLASPAFTGSPTAPTPTTGTGIANKDYVDTKAVQGTSASRTSDANVGSLDTVIASGINDSRLVVPITANGPEFDVDVLMLFKGDPADDVKVQINIPADASLVGALVGPGTNATAAGSTIPQRYGLSTYEGALPIMVFGTYIIAGQGALVQGSLTVRPGATAGNLTFTYCRNSNSSGAAGAGTPVKLMNGSSVRAQAS